MGKIKLCALTTRSMTMRSFWYDTLVFFSQNNIDVTIICEPDDFYNNLNNTNIHYIPIKIKSGLDSPLNIIKKINKLKKIFKKNKFDIVQYASTNMGFYSSIAAKKVNIPVRIFGQWGLRYTGSRGIGRIIYKNIEKIICSNSTHVQGDSPSIENFAICDGVLKKEKCDIIWNGSSTGVDLAKFSPQYCVVNNNIFRKELNINSNCIVFGFIGRINRDKGIIELLKAFDRLNSKTQKDIKLIIVGPMEDDSYIKNQMKDFLTKNKNIIAVGMQYNVLKYYSMFDFLVLPSYREGIATVLLEGCSCGLPIISTNILGSTDVVIENFNGFLCSPGLVDSLFETMFRALNISEGDYNRLSKNSRQLMEEKFDHEKLAKKLLDDRISKYNLFCKSK